MSHTAGPWNVNHQGNTIRAQSGFVADCNDMAIADRDLIAAAPELLLALKQIVGELPSKRDWLNPEIERLARAAIAKAEGKA